MIDPNLLRIIQLLERRVGRLETQDTATSGISHTSITLAVDADTLLGLTGQELTLDTQVANTVLAGPATGAAADPTFRALVSDDLPAHAHTPAVVTVDDSDSPYTVLATDGTIRCDCASGAVSVVLPAATGSGRVLNVKKIDASTNAVTLTPDGAETIDGEATQVFSVQYDNVQLQDAASGAWDVL